MGSARAFGTGDRVGAHEDVGRGRRIRPPRRSAAWCCRRRSQGPLPARPGRPGARPATRLTGVQTTTTSASDAGFQVGRGLVDHPEPGLLERRRSGPLRRLALPDRENVAPARSIRRSAPRPRSPPSPSLHYNSRGTESRFYHDPKPSWKFSILIKAPVPRTRPTRRVGQSPGWDRDHSQSVPGRQERADGGHRLGRLPAVARRVPPATGRAPAPALRGRPGGSARSGTGGFSRIAT